MQLLSQRSKMRTSLTDPGIVLFPAPNPHAEKGLAHFEPFLDLRIQHVI